MASQQKKKPQRRSPTLYALPDAGSEKLRLTMVLPEKIPHWVSTFIGLVASTDWIQLSIVPVTGTSTPNTPDLPVGFRALVAFERFIHRFPRNTLTRTDIPAFEGTGINPVLDSTETPSRLTAEVSNLQPDLILLIGPPDWAHALSGHAKWGCWCLDASLVDHKHAGAALLPPLVSGDMATRLELEIESHGTVTKLPATWGATRRGSFIQQRERSFLKLPALLVRALHQLAMGRLNPAPRTVANVRLARPLATIGAGSILLALGVSLYETLRYQFEKRGPWIPWMVVIRDGEKSIDPGAARMEKGRVVQAPDGVCWADPHVVFACGRHLLYVEELSGRNAGGSIACVELTNAGARRLGAALREAVHLSYPQVFQWEGEWYMTVESSQALRISLYRATEFPLEWQRIEDLVTGWVGVDPTLHHHEGCWYLFANIAECGNSTWDELFLFVSDRLTGPYRPHPANPIVSDVRCARPAGRLFRHGTSLIRPSQDCAEGYGAGLVFNEVLELTPTSYRERSLSRLAPDWMPGLTACHTYSADGGIEVVDARGIPKPGTAMLQMAEAKGRAVNV